LLLPLPITKPLCSLKVYAVRAEAKKAALSESSLGLFGATAALSSDLAALTATGLSNVASMFSPW